MENYVEPIIYNTDDSIIPQEGNNLIDSRSNIYASWLTKDTLTASVITFGFNRVEKTKRCVDSILKYTTDIDYELILIDNGSTDGTYEYFQEVKHPNKRVIKVTKNIGAIFAFQISMKVFSGKYYVLMPNDVCVTKNWLTNLIKCAESDNSIGFVTPVSSNISNLQEVSLGFKDYEDMQRKAEKFNISDPTKWEERMRLINIVTFFKRELIDTFGIVDPGFFHDFGEDDLAARIRRAGYKLILCGDTFVHHDHDFRNFEDKDPIKFKHSLEIGRKNFKDKYYGIDAWDDLNNYERGLTNMIKKPDNLKICPTVLGIDVRCGTPILEIRNCLRRYGITQFHSNAFTTDAKYYADLLFATSGNVKCDRLEYINDYYPNESFDYIILGEPINVYNKPIRLLQRLIELAKNGGTILFKVRNTTDIGAFLTALGNEMSVENDMPVLISIKEINTCLELFGVKSAEISSEDHNVDLNLKNQLRTAIAGTKLTSNVNDVTNSMLIKDYLYCVKK